MHVWKRTYEPVIILHMRGWGREWIIFSWEDHMVFGGNRGGIDRQLTANEEGGSHGFQGDQRGY